MELFVYNWAYIRDTIYGHCVDTSGNYRLLRVRGYLPFCYLDGHNTPSVGATDATLGSVKAVYKRMVTSSNISLRKPFYQVFFSSVTKMQAFVSQHRSECYMDDIHQTTMFLSSNNLDSVGWVHAASLDVHVSNVRPLPERAPYSEPKVMAFDIEVRSSDLGMPRAYRVADTIEMISVVSEKKGQGVLKRFLLHTSRSLLCVEGATEIICKHEYELIMSFFRLIESEDPDIITGYNIFGFDFDYIVSRLKRMLVKMPDVGRGCSPRVDVIRVDWASSAYGANNYDRIVIGGRLIVDMFLYFKRMRLDKYSLEFVSNKFLGEGKISMPFTRMMDIFSSGDREGLRNVGEYCIKDSLLVMMLFDKVDMWIDLCEVAKITRCSIEDIYTRGEQMKVVAQCVKECMDRGIVLQPTREREWYDYEGAYVLEPVKGVYRRCALLDFQSLYPSIIIAYNICPSTYTRNCNVYPAVDVGPHRFMTDNIGLFPGMIKRLLEERKAVKKLMSTCDKLSITYTVLNRRQNALKVCANSVYGIMGFKNSKYFGHVGCAESVTAIGRVFLGRVIEEIESKHHLQVVYGDTDSCMVVGFASSKDSMIKLAKLICEEVTAQLPQPMALVFESYYESVILLSKKRYIMLDEHNKLHYKGVISARRDYCKYAKDTYNDIVGIIARGDATSVKTIREVVEYIDSRLYDLMCNRCDMSELVVTKSVKGLDLYKVNQPHVVMAKRLVKKGVNVPPGTRLEYVFVKGGRTQGDKMMTPEEVTDEGLEIDAKFYIEKQLMTQIDDVLEVIGINGYIQNKYLVDD
jgi:DNA polymerase delta subunit 1